MDCYKIARRIMDMIRNDEMYESGANLKYRSIGYYDNSADGNEFFYLSDGAAELHVIYGEVKDVLIKRPRGIVLFNLRLWLLEIDRIVTVGNL